VQLIDRTILNLSRQNIEYAKLAGLLVGDPGAVMFVSFVGEKDEEVRARVERLADKWRRHRHGYHTLSAVTDQHRAALLKVRKASLGLLMAASTGRRRPLAFVEDTAVHPDRYMPTLLDLRKSSTVTIFVPGTTATAPSAAYTYDHWSI
jgi:FAD linked oxidases, C-terminal domain